MKTALICGVSGQDGAYLAKLLLEKGYRVFGTSRDVLIRLPLKHGLTSAQQSDQVMSALKAENAQAQLQRASRQQIE